MNALEAAMQKLMNTVTITEIDEEPPTVCEVCGGLGLVRYSVPVGDPRFGKLYPCPANCDALAEQRRQRQDRLIRVSHWSEVYDGWNFDNYIDYVDGLGAAPGKFGAYAAALMFAVRAGEPYTLRESLQSLEMPGYEDQIESRSNLVLTGGNGVGKTALLVCACNYLRQNGKYPVFMRLQELMNAIQATYGKDNEETTEEVIAVFRTAPILLIDDFNLENYSPDKREKMEDIIRYRDSRGLPFMATTNLTLDEFYKRWGSRIADIVAKAHWVEQGGHKIRSVSNRAAPML